VHADIRAQVEVTSMVLTFAPIDAGDYVLTVPAPHGAFVTGVDIDRGSGFYQSAMAGEAPPPAIGGSSSAADPAVQAWLGTKPLRADLADLEAGALRVRVTFQRLLRRYRGAVDFTAGIERSPLRAVGDAPSYSVTVALTTSRALTTLDVTGDAQINQQAAAATISWSGQLTGDGTRQVRYAESSSGIEVTFLTHRTPTADPLGGESGYLLLIVDAPDSDPDVAQPRNLSLVVDRSGSMSGSKISQARAAALAMLDHMGPDDRFNLIEFNDSVRPFVPSPVDAVSANLNDARVFINDIIAAGGTDLNAAILAGIADSSPEPERYDAVVLLSDGQATSGETSNLAIHSNVLAANTQKARVFTFSVGDDADVPLMEALARSNRGRHFRLSDAQAASELVDRVRELFEDIRMVRLTDLELEFVGLGASDTLPEQMGDLFSGGQAIMVGRYSVAGTGSVRVRGNDNGGGFLRYVDVIAPERQDANAFIKYVWATEKVGKLLADMSRGGDVSALEDQIRELGLAYRIQTPYTSFSTAGGGGGTSGGGGGGSGGGSGGGGGGGSGWAGGDSGPVTLLLCLGLVVATLATRRRGGDNFPVPR